MKNLKLFILGFVILLSILSCKKNADTKRTASIPELISIQSTNLPTGNSCDKWDLQSSLTSAPFTYSTLRSADNITSSPLLLGQTTMTNQTSAWDSINKQYAVSIGTSILFYNFSSSSVPAPINISISGPNIVEAIDASGGYFFVLTKNKDIDVYSSGSFTILTSLPVATSSYVSNMSHGNSNNLFFITEGKIFKLIVSSTSASIATSPVIIGSGTSKYNGVEFNSVDNMIYAIKRTGTTDEFVRINPTTGAEIILLTSLPYTKDYSRISTALDYTTNTYFIYSSNGHSSNSHSVTTIGTITTAPSIITISSTLIGNRYEFGLQLKD